MTHLIYKQKEVDTTSLIKNEIILKEVNKLGGME